MTLDPVALKSEVQAVTAEFQNIADAADEVLQLSKLDNGRRAVDFGCGTGTWAFVARNHYKELIGIDINEHALSIARSLVEENNWDNVKILDFSEDDFFSINEIDFIMAIDVIPLQTCNHVHTMFDFAKNNLRPGGRLLCTTRRPILFLYELATLRRFRRDYDGIVGGLHRYLALLRSAIEAYVTTEIKRIDRARYYYQPKTVIATATSYGFTEISPILNAPNNPALDKIGWFAVNPRASATLFRPFDWYIFEKSQERSPLE